jgi:hypothetical protein
MSKPMKISSALCSSLLLFLLATNAAYPLDVQSATGTAKSASMPVTVEYYYRVRWGAMDEFLRLYRKNHEPLLLEMKKQGWITRIEQNEPFTHMAGGQRWDLRITLVYRDAEAAVGVGGPYDQAAEAATKRLFPDKATYEAEEARRFSLLDEHWDVIVKPASAP